VKVLVTGGAGYIGSVVTARLLAAGHRVVVLDDLSTGHRDAVPAGAGFVPARVHDAGRVLDGSYDGVLHFAAYSLVAESVLHPERYWENNVVGSLALLAAMRAHRVPRIVFSSSAATYGVAERMPITEDAPTRPINPYGHGKRAVDRALASYAQVSRLAAVSLRYFNVAGGYLTLGERHDPETHLVPNLLRAAAAADEPVSVFGTDYPTVDGTAVRDYVHVVDVADAHLLALEAAVPGRHLVFNLGSGTGYTVRQVLAAARQVTGRPIPVVERPRRAGDPPVLIASHRRITAELGWRPVRMLTEMIADAWRLAAVAS
jgi:UDP-glucose 4-epimerase